MNLTTFFSVLLLIFSINAQTLTTKPSEKTFEDVKLLDSVSFEDGTVKADLKSVSYGLRKKTKFGLITVSVYVAEFFVADPTKLQKTSDGILASLKTAGPVQLRLTVSRDLTGEQISDSFAEAFKANDIDLEKTSKELTDVLSAIKDIKKFKKGDVFSLTIYWMNTTATLLIQKPDQSIQKISGPDKLATDLFSIWFGISADTKLEDLKKALLK
jgi:Chalcone isomerase-like